MELSLSELLRTLLIHLTKAYCVDPEKFGEFEQCLHLIVLTGHPLLGSLFQHQQLEDGEEFGQHVLAGPH